MKMKSILITFFVTAILSFSYCQAPIIAQSDYYQLGGEYLRINKFDIELNSVSIGSSGTNITWDFSTVDFGHPSVIFDTISCILPNGTPFFNEPGVNYRLSNYCLSRDDDTYLYYRLENDSLNFIGDWADNGVSEKWFYSFSNLRTDLIFPFTYNDSHTDTFESSYNDMSGSDWHYQTGSTEVTVDGYGEIITPDGNTIKNTVRVKEVVSIVDSNVLFGVNNYINTSYYWYSADEEGPILQLDMHPTLPNTINNAYYFKKIGQISSISELLATPSFNIYPNPTSNSFNISIVGNIGDDFVVSIYNYSGKLVKIKENILSNTVFTNNEDLSPGIYVVELSEKKIPICRQKLVIQ
tara:strand:- start:183 stop:1241 length:1059 start_codon:yes stop_codon:yes gene_type:complete